AVTRLTMVQYEEHIVNYGEKSIFYLAAGPRYGPLIIFMHGWPGIAKTWHAQLDTFSALGFRVVAPDMPGYGRSTARKDHSDYAQEAIIEGMLALLADTGRDRAIWIGHDWGCGTLWTLANTHPQVCTAVAGLCVPFGVLEMGLEELVKFVNRDVYPESEYPNGQWDYMAYYEQSFDAVITWYDKQIHGFLKALTRAGDPAALGKPTVTSTVVKDGGWFGGIESPPPPEAMPDGQVVMDPEVFSELVAAMEKTGFGPGSAWYLNHKANRAYNLKESKHDGKLKMPVLFVNARYDVVCETVRGRLAETQRKNCLNLTETIIDAGHWVVSEKPVELNSAIARWLVEQVPEEWPMNWSNGWTKRQVKE
ncbi:alpha/beta-hydrolase, partial [Thozetella sp. PMI_491]